MYVKGLKFNLTNMFIDTKLGGMERCFLTKPKDYNMFIPNEIRDCVVFICDENKIPRATGFLVSMQGNSPSLHFIYLVTAKHNVINIADKDFFIRINGKDGKIHYLRGNSSVQWIYHPEHANNPADVAVIPFPFDENKFLSKTIPSEMFLKQKLIDDGTIGIGNNVFITGLFTHLSGKQRNMPIIRVGNIAMLPDEKVSTKMFGDIDSYLIEARSIGGVSGSPVFFVKPQETKNGGVTLGASIFYLGGLIHGHWDTLESRIDSYLPTEDVEVMRNINMGIAIVTPVNKILETLNSNELIQNRVDVEKEIEKSTLPTAD